MPHVLHHNLKHNRALHAMVVFYTARFLKAPRVSASDHLKICKLRPDIVRVVAYYGFMEHPDVPRDLAIAERAEGLGLDLDSLTYFVGQDVILASKDIGMSGWRSWLYTLMERNEMHHIELRTPTFEIVLCFRLGKNPPARGSEQSSMTDAHNPSTLELERSMFDVQNQRPPTS